ncbi:MAG: abscisic acid-deficient protein Aba4 family protein [Verrucomicrobiota bacterium]
MTPDHVFNIVNPLALLSWIYLIVAARWTPRIFSILRYGLPIAYALVYLTCMLMAEPNKEAGYQSLEQVTAIFTQPWVIVGAWIHYLDFDFFVGCWILEKSKAESIGHGWIVVPMIFTFILGPIGLLLFLILLGFRKRKRIQTATA